MAIDQLSNRADLQGVAAPPYRSNFFRTHSLKKKTLPQRKHFLRVFGKKRKEKKETEFSVLKMENEKICQ